MNNNRTKTINGKKPFYYKDIIDYIKSQNKKITQLKPETKTIYQNIIQQHTKQFKIAIGWVQSTLFPLPCEKACPKITIQIKLTLCTGVTTLDGKN